MEFADPYNMPDPEDERREREAAIAALAAGGAPLDPEVESARAAPVALPESDLARVSRLRTAVAENDPSPPEVPGAIPDLPEPDAVDALAAAGRTRAPEPGEGASSAFRSPTSQDAPVPGQIKEQPPTTTPSASPVAEKEPPPQQDPLEALMLRGEEQKRKQLEAYDKEGAPGVNGWALLADVAFNHGKSIPGILQQVDNDKRAYREGRQKLLTGGGASSDPVNQMLRMKQLELATGREGRILTAAEQKVKNAQDAAAQDKTSADQLRNYAKGQGFYTEAMEGMSFKDLMGMKGFLRTDQDHANAPRIAEDKANERTATTHAANVTDYNDREIKGDVAGAIRGAQVAEEQALLPERPMTKQQLEAEARAKEAADRQARRDASNDARADRGEERQTQNDAVAFNRDFSKNTDSAKKVAKSVGVLEDSLTKNPKLFDSENNLGAGIAGFVAGDKVAQRVRGYQADAASTPERKAMLKEQIAFRDNYLKAMAFSLKDATGLSGNLTEQDQNMIRTGGSPNASLAEMQAGMEIMARDARDKISSEGTQRSDLADENLVASGLDPERWAPGLATARKKRAGNPQPPAAGNPGSVPGGFANPPELPAGGYDLPATLPDGPTGPRGKPPAAPVSPPAAAEQKFSVVIHYTDPFRQPKPAMLTREQIADLEGRRGIMKIGQP